MTQTKHHWWWKANQVFDVLKSTKTFNGSVVFLEEDHLLAPDVLHILRLMEQKKNVIAEKVLLLLHIKVFLPPAQYRSENEPTSQPETLSDEIFLI